MILLLVVSGFNAVTAQSEDQYAERIQSLLTQMTLEEKAGQLNQLDRLADDKVAWVRQGLIGSLLNVAGANRTNEIQAMAVSQSRLGIPILYGIDVIHGYRTIFPIPLAQSCSWDPDLVQRIEAVAAKEARAAGILWTFAPMVDIARDARWGRIAEGAGEDPFLGSVMAAARVKGFQGTSLSDPGSVVACIKHFAGYGRADAGRDYNRVDVSEKCLREIYFPPFQAGVQAGAKSLMTAFNTLNGIPATANHFLIHDVLKGDWGYDGFIVSDYPSVRELIVHGYAVDEADAAEKAILAGVDMDMMGSIYVNELPKLVQEGIVPIELLNQSVERILRIKMELGLFDRPYTDPQHEEATLLHPDHLALAREAAAKSAVLLKNEGGMLPLSKDIKRLALVGPLADSPEDYLGTWSCKGEAADVVTILDAIENCVSQYTEVLYTEGCPAQGDDDSGLKKAVDMARGADAVIAVVGESRDLSGEAASRTSLDLPGRQRDLLKALVKTGVPVVAVVMSGRPLTIPWMADNVSSILHVWHPGIQGGPGVADVLFGDMNPSGKLTASFPYTVGQCPIFYNHENTGRPAGEQKYTSKYLDSPVTPLFPFGWGLSYTTFDYANLTLNDEEVGVNDTITVQAEIENTGSIAGEEIVQLYIRDKVASLVRPVRELKGFRKIMLQPGEKKTVTFVLGKKELGFFGPEAKFIVEPGEFQVWVAPNAVSGLEGGFRVVGGDD